jgi:hypothetical protein
MVRACVVRFIVMFSVFCIGGPRLLLGQESEQARRSGDHQSSGADSVEAFTDEMVQDQPIWIGLGAGTGLVKLRKLYGIQEITASVGANFDESHWLQFSGSYMHTPIPETDDPVYSIADGVSLAEIQAEVRFFTPAQYTFLVHYFSAGGGVVVAFWKYDRGFSFADPTSTPTDILLGFDIHVGTGFVFGDPSSLALNLDLTPGVVLWSHGTDEEYVHAVLPGYFYFKVRLGLAYALDRP